MAKIRVRGDTSGYVDIAAPDVAGAATVNLDKIPQTDQTVSFNGNVGIGTASPSTPLDVTKAGGGNYIATFQNTTSATPYGVFIKDAPSGANGYPLLNIVNSAASQTYFRVDSGTGVVTTPKQPAFYVGGSGNSVYSGFTFLGDQTFSNRVNIGNHYNYANGRFTAPVAGRYFFTYIAVTENTASHFVDINKNDVRATHSPLLNYGVIYQPGTNVAILDLVAGDYVTAARRDPSGYDIYTSSFMGYLIG